MTDAPRPVSASGGPLRAGFSLRARILLGYLLMMIVFGGVLVAVLLGMNQTQMALTTLDSGYLPLARQISAAESSPLGLELEPGQSPDRLYRVRRTERKIIDGLERQLIQARDTARALAKADLNPGDGDVLLPVVAGLDEVLQQLAEYEVSHNDLIDAVENNADDKDALVLDLIEQRRRIEDRLEYQGRRVTGRLSRVLSTTQRGQRSARIAITALSGVAFGIGLALVLATGFMLRPIRQLIASAERLRAGAWNEPLPVTSDDEVGRLARSFNAMAHSIVERERKLAERSQQLEQLVAELRSSQAALIRSERLATIGQMAAQIAHEVRNPLNALGLNAEMLVDEIQDNDEAKEIVVAIRGEVQRLVGITEDYLALGRAPPLRLEPFPVDELVQDLVRFQNEEHQQAGVDVSVELSAVPEVQADANQLRQALLNILRNAVEALDEGGRVRISVAPDDGMVLITIADDGPGMDAEHVARIFDPFFSTKESGSGLGLPLTHQVIAEHGGRIACTSAPGEGTAFSIWLPVAGEPTQ